MTRTLRYTVSPDFHGTEIRTFVRRELELSASVLRDLKYRGEILLNGRRALATERLSAGDTLTLTLSEHARRDAANGTLPPVLYEDEDFLILNKPAGMPIYPTPGHDTDSLLNAAAEKCAADDFLFRPMYRLDRDTTGVFVLAKNRFAAGARLEKRYLAVCEGELPPEGEIDAPIGLLPGHRVQRTVGIGQPARTLYRRITFDGLHSLAVFRLMTGRTHQIRVHMSSLGHPVAGDDLYGGSVSMVSRQMLLCAVVRLTSKALGKDLCVRASFSEAQKNAFPELFREEHAEILLF